jgi:NitT/TauT family transport system substrate-binding protein
MRSASWQRGYIAFRVIALRLLTAAAFAAAAAVTSPLHAEVNELRIARQYGISFIQFMVMEDQRLIEKHAQQAGLGNVKVIYRQMTSAGAANDALLSGQLDLVGTGIPSVVLLWEKTRGTLGVKALVAANSVPQYLLTRNPTVRSIQDFTDRDRIAVPTVKLSGQAMLLQMAAAREFGATNYAKLDGLTVSMPHPDAAAAMVSGAGEITAHFTVPPFHYRELAKPGIRTITTSREILGGTHSILAMVATSQFHDANPRLVRAFLGALEEATAFVNRDKRAAAEIYIRIAKDGSDIETIFRMLSDPDNEFTITPQATMKYAEFMYQIGSIKAKPASWKDLFFPEAHDLPGS